MIFLSCVSQQVITDDDLPFASGSGTYPTLD